MPTLGRLRIGHFPPNLAMQGALGCKPCPPSAAASNRLRLGRFSLKLTMQDAHGCWLLEVGCPTLLIVSTWETEEVQKLVPWNLWHYERSNIRKCCKLLTHWNGQKYKSVKLAGSWCFHPSKTIRLGSEKDPKILHIFKRQVRAIKAQA